MENLTLTMLEAVEDQLRQVGARANGSGLEEMHHMLAYHLGWEGEASGRGAAGNGCALYSCCWCVRPPAETGAKPYPARQPWSWCIISP